MPKLEFGQIIKAWVLDRRGGNRKRRDCVIVSREEDIATHGQFAVVMISSKNLENVGVSDDIHVLLRFRAAPLAPHPETLLTKRCAAICDWHDVLAVDQVERFGGKLNKTEMALITKNVAAIRQKMMEASAESASESPPAAEPEST